MTTHSANIGTLIKVGKATLHVTDVGQGPVMVLVHGFPLDHTMWAGQISALAKTHRVLAPDLRGFGNSPAIPGTTTMDDFADDLKGLLDQLCPGQKITLCGLSMGGYVAFAFWRKYANLLQRLILCDTQAHPDTEQGAQDRRAMALRVEKEGPDPLIQAMIPKLVPAEFAATEVARMQELTWMMRRASAVGIAAAARGMAVRPDSRPNLPNIQVPTLVICGEHDAITSVEKMHGLAADIPQSQFEIINGAGHMAPWEVPKTTNAILLNFLSRPV